MPVELQLNSSFEGKNSILQLHFSPSVALYEHRADLNTSLPENTIYTL
jgi:hypothetical protein